MITYELGGGRVLSNLLQSPLSTNNLINVASICIVIDLSKPGNCIESLLFWITEVKKYSMASLKDLKQSKPEELAVLQQRLQDYWNNVPAANDRN